MRLAKGSGVWGLMMGKGCASKAGCASQGTSIQPSPPTPTAFRGGQLGGFGLSGLSQLLGYHHLHLRLGARHHVSHPRHGADALHVGKAGEPLLHPLLLLLVRLHLELKLRGRVPRIIHGDQAILQALRGWCAEGVWPMG